MSASMTEMAPANVATQSAASSRLPNAAGRSRIGTARIAYVHAVANQIHTKLAPPAANSMSTTSAGSRSMSGQLNVADRRDAAAAKAIAPTINRTPVVRRIARVPLSVVTPCRLSVREEADHRLTLSYAEC